MIFQDSPEVAARRAEVDGRLGPVNQQLARGGTGIDVNTIRLKAYLEYIASMVGDRNEAEMLFLDMTDQAVSDAERMMTRATLLAPGPGIQAR